MNHLRDYPSEFPSPKLDDTALDTLEAQISEVCGHLNAATFRFLELIAEFDRTQGWARHGLANCAQWLNWQCGIGACAAREKVRVARALESLPRISDAFRQGHVSYSKARAMTRVATPENEDTLLNIALHGTASHVERTVRKFRRVQKDMERRQAEDVHQSRYVRCWHEEDGSWRLQARLSPEVGALVEQAIEAAMAAEADTAEGKTHSVEPAAAVSAETHGAFRAEQHVSAETNGTAASEPAVSAESPEAEKPGPPVAAYTFDSMGRRWPVSAETPDEPPSPSASRADGLRHMAEQFLARRSTVAGAGADRYQVVVHIAQDALRDAGTAGSAGLAGSCEVLGGAELEEGREIAVETARRLGCGGSLVGLVEDQDGEPLNVGRKTRAISPAIQRALRSRDGGCRFPGCDRTRFTHAHHIRHWADGGETSLSNLVTLCYHHHHLVHEGGYGVWKVDGEIEFTSPDGRPIPPAGRNGHWRGWRFRGTGAECPQTDPGELPLAVFNGQRGVAIDADTARCGWRGERMDYGMAMETLCWQSGMGL